MLVGLFVSAMNTYGISPINQVENGAEIILSDIEFNNENFIRKKEHVNLAKDVALLHNFIYTTSLSIDEALFLNPVVQLRNVSYSKKMKSIITVANNNPYELIISSQIAMYEFVVCIIPPELYEPYKLNEYARIAKINNMLHLLNK